MDSDPLIPHQGRKMDVWDLVSGSAVALLMYSFVFLTSANPDLLEIAGFTLPLAVLWVIYRKSIFGGLVFFIVAIYLFIAISIWRL